MSDLFRFDGKTIVVIGAGSGIGRAVALGAAQHGAPWHVSTSTPDAARKRPSAIGGEGGRGRPCPLDITDAIATDRVLDTFAAARAIDGLVCTPSINVRKKLLDYSADEFDRVVRST